MGRSNRSVMGAAVLISAIGLFAAAGTTVTAQSSSPVASGGADSACQPEERGAGAAGTPGLGTLRTPLPQGRVLMTVGALAGPSGAFAVAVIDQTGLHEVDTAPDWTMSEATWETSDTVLFDSARAGERHLFRLHLGDGSVDQLTSDPEYEQGGPSPLPDGRIVHEQWSCTSGLNDGLRVARPDGTDAGAITEARSGTDMTADVQPHGSPDGRTIVFLRDEGDGTGALFTVPTDGGTPTRLTAAMQDIVRPRWSPDGRTILFSANQTELWTVPAAGGTPTQLTHGGGQAFSWEGHWSPDGAHILFSHWVLGADHTEIHEANSDGTDEQVLWVGDHSSAEEPDWGD
jgi:hypothetical protein